MHLCFRASDLSFSFSLSPGSHRSAISYIWRHIRAFYMWHWVSKTWHKQEKFTRAWEVLHVWSCALSLERSMFIQHCMTWLKSAQHWISQVHTCAFECGSHVRHHTREVHTQHYWTRAVHVHNTEQRACRLVRNMRENTLLSYVSETDHGVHFLQHISLESHDENVVGLTANNHGVSILNKLTQNADQTRMVTASD